MISLLIGIYRYFRAHKIVFYSILLASVLVLGFYARQVRFDENISSFFPSTRQAENAEFVFSNLKIKDKVIVFLSSTDSINAVDNEDVSIIANELRDSIEHKLKPTLVKDVFLEVDQNLIEKTSNLIYDNLPLFLDSSDYQRIDSLVTNNSALDNELYKAYSRLLTPAGYTLKNFVARDPLGIGNEALKNLENFRMEGNYTVSDGHVYSEDGKHLLMFITPVYGLSETGLNEQLIDVLEKQIDQLNRENPTVVVKYFGGPSVSVYNARQIKQDVLYTSLFALVVITVFLLLVFRKKRALILVFAPVAFGVLFSLCFIFFIKGSISIIAMGAGSAVIGIALSYSIHMLSHQNHSSSVEQLIREIASPLTIGSFTTIGAFLGLLFTSSKILQDFGLFTSLVLVGTTLFCLLFLPQFLSPQSNDAKGFVLSIIDRINSYKFEKNRWLIGLICVLTIIGLYASQYVRFNDDMMKINYWPKHLEEAEMELSSMFQQDKQNVFFVSVGTSFDKAAQEYAKTNQKLDSLQAQGLVEDYASISDFVLSEAQQQDRLDQWNTYWQEANKARVYDNVSSSGESLGFKRDAFANFKHLIDRSYTSLSDKFTSQADNGVLEDWITLADGKVMLITQVKLNADYKELVYSSFSDDLDLVIFDRAYFTNQWVSSLNADFNLVLLISSILVFVALWISYGRIELAILSFLPMFLSWVIIVGLMGIFGIEFNIINIILATFIFGIGDDFSIFIMDGLTKKYSEGEEIINSHKTAIFFSAFTILVGMGVLIVAKHPALYSIALISILGIATVVLVSYTIQPVIFNLLITKPTSKGLAPNTLYGIVRTLAMFVLFVVGCLVINIYILVSYLIPISKRMKQATICYLMHLFSRLLLKCAWFVRKDLVNIGNERFKTPMLLIANHQSFIDIIGLLALSPKIVLITNKWVWNSPLFGYIVRSAGFQNVDQGYETSLEKLQDKINEGYSIAVFPEGTRSLDGSIKRFRKGAFALAKSLHLDILPVLFHGNNLIIAKSQPFYVYKGKLACRIFERVSYDDPAWGDTYQETSKNFCRFFRQEYARIEKQEASASNPLVYEALVSNYIYKGPVVEWYIRVKVKMEKCYDRFDRIIPRDAIITDIGCGLGPLCYLLSMLSDKRQILGLDYDSGKIAIAKRGWLKTPQLDFIYANALDYDLPYSDVFILNDMLHYMAPTEQALLVSRCSNKLNPGGQIIIRDGDSSNHKKHKLTKITEFLSTKVFCFNQTDGNLSFTSEQQIRDMAISCGMSVEALPNDKYTSNTIYILEKHKG